MMAAILAGLESCCSSERRGDGEKAGGAAAPPVLMPGARVSSLADVRAARDKGHFDSIWKGMWYCGRDDNYHYFANATQLGRTGFAVSAADVIVTGEFPLTLSAEDWRDVSQLGLEGGEIRLEPRLK